VATILQIESSHPLSSVSLAADGNTLLEIRGEEAQNHASQLGPMVQSLLDRAGFSIQSLDAVAISIGPGSYTGLRIGLSLAKGICYGSTIPLIPVSTLACMTACAINQYPMQETLYCPMIDARRMEVYTALFDHTGTLLSEPEAYILDNKPFREQTEQRQTCFFGSGTNKAIHLLEDKNSKILTNFIILSSGMNKIALNAYNKGIHEDPAYLEPVYLKEFYHTNGK